MTRRRARQAAYLAGALGPVALGAALYPGSGHLAPADQALVFVAAVVGVASAGFVGPALVAAVVSDLSFDYFCTRPYLSFRIASGSDVTTAALLMVVGVVVTFVAMAGQRARVRARDESDRLRRLHAMAEQVAGGDPVDVLIATAGRQLEELLHLRACRFTRQPPAGAARLERDGSVTLGGRAWDATTLGLPTTQVTLDVLAGGTRLGAFLLTPTPATPVSAEARRAAVTLVDQLGPVLPRPHR